MKFSEAWLREWVDPPISTAELGDQLSMAGLEVDAITPVAPDFDGVVVGEVLAVEPHPDAKKLRVCRVEAGQTEPLTIVCGAANVAAGMRVPTALVGASLPGGLNITQAELRGIESRGMLCAAAELGLAESSEGIMALPADAPIGEDIRSFLKLKDESIELDLTPDRGDCLGIAGIAREVGVINRCPVKELDIAPVAPEIDDRFEVRLDAPLACPRYVCRVIRGIDARAETPVWMQERLRRSGIRSLGPVVDVTNYVLLELGQPMHGFDLGKLDSFIQVRMANQGETLELFGGEEVELTAESLVIADAKGPLALAGIMGGAASGVAATTTDILLESAFFEPQVIIGKARGYGLHTDSSHRFERGVDPQLQARAIERATQLLLRIAGGSPGPVVDRMADPERSKPESITLRRTRIGSILGVGISDEEVVDILTRLGMHIEPLADGWSVTAPSSRFDIAIEVDLIEELGRVYGYSRIPTNRAASAMEMQPVPETRFDLHRAKQVLVDRGYQEAITYSFIDPEHQALIDPEQVSIALANPIAAQMSVMRTSLWPGLLEVARYNQARQQERVRLFESGRRFLQGEADLQQGVMLAGLVTGRALPEQWGEASRGVDLFDVKADLEAVLGLLGRADDFRFSPNEHPSLHPGQTAAIELNGMQLGWLGMLHPRLEKQLELLGRTYLFEILLDGLADEGALAAFQPISKYPALRRDIAIVVDQHVEFKLIKDCIYAVSPEILRDILLFDVYTGGNIDSGRKSLALGLILQETSHTLTDEKVDSAVEVIIEALSTQLSATLRE